MNKRLVSLTLCLLGATAMVLPSVLTKPQIKSAEDEEFESSIVYEDPKDGVVELSKMEVVRADSEEGIVIPDVVKLHYINDDNACLGRRFYTWVTGLDGIERMYDTSESTVSHIVITMDFSDPEFKGYAGMPSLFFIIKVSGTWSGQSEDVELKYENFQDNIAKVGDKNVLELWTIPGEGSSIEFCTSEEETRIPKIATAKFTNWKTIHCVSSDPTSKILWYKVYAFDKSYLTASESSQKNLKEFYCLKEKVFDGTTVIPEFDIEFNYPAHINVQYLIESQYAGYTEKPNRKVFVSFENLYTDPRFDEYYTYSGKDLGATYSKESTTFKLWSPISASVELRLYDNGTPSTLGGDDNYRRNQMFYTGNGVWELTVKGDLASGKGKFYTYAVTNPLGTKIETVDPYAKACGINGLRGYVYDKEATNPTGWDQVSYTKLNSPQDLSIYEVHIRDLTMDKKTWLGSEKPGTYKAFIEKGTTYTEDFQGQSYTVKTGFDHIEELGVNAVQLLPVFDHDDDERPDKMKFNWGYNPLNYNCVEGGYSSDPSDPLARIREYKELVKAFANNANNTRIIMDVVYNHVSSASSSCFTKTMPKYYFRYDANWNYQNGSGCANEVKTEAKMMRKYIVDSLCWWASDYKIKGFRFDLMGLIDVETMRQARNELTKIDPDIYIYGEGWQSIDGYHGVGVGPADSANVYAQLENNGTTINGWVGAFNDEYRNATRGGNDWGYGTNNAYPSRGFITQEYGEMGKIVDGIWGYHTGKGGNPSQCIVYVSCHDNYTAYDQIRFGLSNSDGGQPTGTPTDPINVVRAVLDIHAMTMMSNGVAFMQGGEEIYRTKTIAKKANDSQGIRATPEYDELLRTDLPKDQRENATVRPYPDYVTYDENHEQIEATGEVRMYGTDAAGNPELVSHNSYRLPDSVNSFKYDRKIHIGDTNTYQYINQWKELLKVRNETRKVSKEENPWEVISKFETMGDSTSRGGLNFPAKNSGTIHLIFSSAGDDNWLQIGTGRSFRFYTRNDWIDGDDPSWMRLRGFGAYIW